MLSNLELTQYLTAKICHDLSGTLGAINNGVDFLTIDNQEMREKAIALVKTSAEQSINRLMFLRHAYGISKALGEANLDEVKALAVGYLKESKVNLNFHEKYFHIPGVYISANVGKVILCLTHHAYACLIHGGDIDIAINADGSTTTISIEAKGNNPKIDLEKHEILQGKPHDYPITTHNVHSFYLNALIKDLDLKLQLETSNSAIKYVLTITK